MTFNDLMTELISDQLRYTIKMRNKTNDLCVCDQRAMKT